MAVLDSPARRFDVVFLDPPFDGPALENLCKLLAQGWLSAGAYIYLETGRKQNLPTLPAGWSVAREKTTAQVRYALARNE